jgi:hypothetical protein
MCTVTLGLVGKRTKRTDETSRGTKSCFSCTLLHFDHQHAQTLGVSRHGNVAAVYRVLWLPTIALTF